MFRIIAAIAGILLIVITGAGTAQAQDYSANYWAKRCLYMHAGNNHFVPVGCKRKGGFVYDTRSFYHPGLGMYAGHDARGVFQVWNNGRWWTVQAYNNAVLAQNRTAQQQAYNNAVAAQNRAAQQQAYNNAVAAQNRAAQQQAYNNAAAAQRQQLDTQLNNGLLFSQRLGEMHNVQEAMERQIRR
jgi:hypothetical protein